MNRLDLDDTDDASSDDETSAEEVEDREQVRFYRRYELFVGNLANGVQEVDVVRDLESELPERDKVQVVDFIQPFRGRAFAFIRCSSQRGFNILLGSNNILIDGRFCRIARSRRVTGQSDSDEDPHDEPETAPERLDEENNVRSAPTAYAILRQGAERELTELENEFQAQFSATTSVIDNLKRKREDKKEEKSRLEKQVQELQESLARTESEDEALLKQIALAEKSFDTFVHLHTAKVNSIRDRIFALKLDRNQTTAEVMKKAMPPSIADDFDCICCYEEMGVRGAMIFQCEEGHLICSKCHQRLENCPLCRKPYPKPGIRCRLAESIANHIS